MTVTRPTSTESGRAGSADFQAILSRIADASETIDRERQMPEDLIDAMVEQGLFRLLVPRSVGGGETDFLDYLAMAQAVAAADGKHGMVLQPEQHPGDDGVADARVPGAGDMERPSIDSVQRSPTAHRHRRGGRRLLADGAVELQQRLAACDLGCRRGPSRRRPGR